MIRAVLVGDDKLKAWLKSRVAKLQGTVVATMTRLVIMLTRKIKEEKLSGQVLKNRTGRLRRSISPDVKIGVGTSVVGSVSTNVEYAGIHEYGGVINHPGSVPRHGAALRWLNPGYSGPLNRSKSGKLLNTQAAGAWVFAKSTEPHKIVMPERSFMRTALAEMKIEIRTEFENCISEVLYTRRVA